MSARKNQLIQQLIHHTAELAALGMTPATSSNFSARISESLCLITVSGRDKGSLTSDDFMEINMDGTAVDTTQTSSAETLLHTQIYALRSDANVVLHTHSLAQTLLSMHFEQSGKIDFTGYELQKAFTGIKSHHSTVCLPIVANSQDMSTLCESALPLFEQANFWGYLIAGHGIYTWGKDMQEARRHLDAFEFLLNAELTKLSFRR
jgi:methylthioribulose-1-phosphate dehydratase